LPLAVPAGATGTVSGRLTAADFTGAGNLTYAQTLEAIASGGTYLNVHTAKYPGGEVRGQLVDPEVANEYTITADWAAGVPDGEVWAFNDFFPRSLTVARGSTIRFDIQGFHTGTILPASVSVLESFQMNGLIQPDDAPETNANGTTGVVQNPGALAPVLPSQTCGADGNPCHFDGSHVVSVGPNFGPPVPPTDIYVSAAPGSYVIHCLIHPTMIGRLNVVSSPADFSVSSPDDMAAAIAAQVSAEVANAERADQAVERVTSTTLSNGSKTWAAWAGYDLGHATVLEFPKVIRITSGDRVRWNIQSRDEPHTVTFPNDIGLGTIIVCETGDTEVPATPNNTPPQGPGDFACPGGGDLQVEVGGGNGVRTVTSPTTESDSGVITTASYLRLMGVPTTAALRSWTVSFTGAAPGTYTYLCTIHGEGMSGTIIVE
jgi:plastocyanin